MVNIINITSYLANIARGHLIAAARSGPTGLRLEKWDPLVLPGELVGGVHLPVALPAQRRLVGAAHHRRLRHLAHIAQHLHPYPHRRWSQLNGSDLLVRNPIS